MKAVIVGSGPNGLAAACVLARAGVDVTVMEAQPTAGGAARSGPALGPDTVVDFGAACHPFGAVSPVFEELDLEDHGLEWVRPDIAAAHPLDNAEPGLLYPDLERTADNLGRDGRAWRMLHQAPLNNWSKIVADSLGPLLRWPSHPVAMAGFGVRAPWPAELTGKLFQTDQGRGLLAGSATHATLPMSAPLTTAFAVMFNILAFANGWPVARGGTQSVIDALGADLTSHGGRIETNHRITDVRELGSPEILMLDLTPRQILHLRGLDLPPRYRRALHRWKYGTAVHKVDLLLDGPVPWYDSRIGRAGTIHIGGTLSEIDHAERLAARGVLPERPFVMAAQPTIVDPSRAPVGTHILWAYAHVPHGFQGPANNPLLAGDRIINHIERFAPGLREHIIRRVDHTPEDLASNNENLVGGSIGGGSLTGLQQLFRPAPKLNPYRTGASGVYICSSATPPGGGVHGMAGYHAATTALADLR